MNKLNLSRVLLLSLLPLIIKVNFISRTKKVYTYAFFLCLALNFNYKSFAQNSVVRNISIQSPQTLNFTGNDNILKNPERGLSLKAGYFDLFVDDYNYDGAIKLELSDSEDTLVRTFPNRSSFSAINMRDWLTKFQTVDLTSNTMHTLVENEPIISGDNVGYTVNLPNRSSGNGLRNFCVLQITNCTFSGTFHDVLNIRFQYQWIIQGAGWALDYGFKFYDNSSPAVTVGYDANPVYDEVDKIDFSFADPNVLHIVTNKGNLLDLGISNTSKFSFSATSHANKFSLESYKSNGNRQTDLGHDNILFTETIKTDWTLDIATNISHDVFELDLASSPISTSSHISYNNVTTDLDILDTYFNTDIVSQATNSDLTLPEDFINDNGISIVELEQFVHFSELNISSGNKSLDNFSVEQAVQKFQAIEDLGLKSHLVLNSDLRLGLSNDGTSIEIPEMSEFDYLMDLIDTLDESIYSDQNSLVVFSQLGLMAEHNDYNYYRQSATWLNSNSKYFALNGITPTGSPLSETKSNEEGSLRSSDQKSGWKYYAASSPKTGYPYISASNQIQYIREEVIDKVSNVFENKKILLEEVLPWNQKMTFPQIGTDDNYESNSNLGFYDGAFGTDYGSLYSICHEGQIPPNSTDFTSLEKRDLYVLGKHSNNFWVHGEMPVYMTDEEFDSKFSAQTDWVNNHQFNYDVFKGMVTATADQQNALKAAKKMRMFNYSSFDITMNDSENNGLNLYQKTNPIAGAGAIDKWRSTSISQTLADQMDLPYSTNYFNESRNVFEYIRDHLGYRLELQSLSTEVDGDSLVVSATIQNRGFSSPKNDRDIYFVILDEDGTEIEKVQIQEDWKTWTTDSSLDNKKNALTGSNYHNFDLDSDLLSTSIQYNSYDISASLSLSNLNDNEQYTIALWMPDLDNSLNQEKYSVQLANEQIEKGTRGENLLSTFVYNPSLDLEFDNTNYGVLSTLNGTTFNFEHSIDITDAISLNSVGVKYLLSTDDLPSSDDLILGYTSNYQMTQNANGSVQTTDVNLLIPNTVAEGNWNLIMILDPQNLEIESDENNNVKVVDFKVLTPEENFANHSEFGFVNEGSQYRDDWKIITLDNHYTNPIIVIGGLSYKESQPLAGARIQILNSNTFAYKLDEWYYLDGAHLIERINYMVMEEGQYTMSNGKNIIASKLPVNNNFSTIGQNPTGKLVFAQAMTYNSHFPITTRIKRNSNSISFKLQREQQLNPNIPTEDVGYIIIDDGIDNVQIGNYNMKTNSLWASAHWRTLNNVPYNNENVMVSSLSSNNRFATTTVRYTVHNNQYRFKIQGENSVSNQMSRVYENISILIMTPSMNNARLSSEILDSDEVNSNYEIDGNFDFGLSPNPAVTDFTILLNNDDFYDKEFELEVYDSFGRLLMNQTGVKHRSIIDIDYLPSGAYQVVLKSNDTRINQTLIIRK